MGYSIWEIMKAFIDDHFELAINLYTQAIATTPTTPSSTPIALRLTSNPTISPVTNPLQTRRRASTVLSPTHSRAPALGLPEDPQSQSTRGPESRAQFQSIMVKDRLVQSSVESGACLLLDGRNVMCVSSSEHFLCNRMLEVKVATPKDLGSKMHRGIGFITFENADNESLITQPLPKPVSVYFFGGMVGPD